MKRVLTLGVCIPLLAAPAIGAPLAGGAERLGATAVTDDSSLEAQWAWQVSIADYKDRLVNAAIREPNHTGEVLDTIDHTLVLMGTGSPTQTVRSIMDAAPSQITVSWQEVPFTKTQLETAGAVASRGAAVWAIHYASDGTGVTIDFDPSAGKTLGALPDNVGGIPVTWQPSDQPLGETLDGRGNGSAPFYGGSRITRPAGGGYVGHCSTGTKVKKANGETMMLTAHHCNFIDYNNLNSGGEDGINWRLSGDDTPIGQSTGMKDRQWDVQGIDGQTYSTGVWLGGATQNNTLDYVTIGAGHLSKGELVYTDGGWSGSATAKVDEADVDGTRYCGNDDNNFCDPHNNFVKLKDYDENGDPIAGQRDSGGPALQYTDSGYLKFAGLIVFGLNDVPNCIGIDDGRQCYTSILISPWDEFKSALNLTLPG